MKPLPKDLVDVVSRVMQGANPVVKESVAKDAAHMARLRTNAYIGDGSEATVNKAHQANIKKHGEKVAKAIHTNADHEAAHNATSVGSAGHKVHNDFVKNHLGGHGSAAHKDYHKHMEKKYMDSISEGYVLAEEQVIMESEIAKSSANLTAHMIDHNIGEGSHAAVKMAHQANIKKHGAEVANAIHANASHEAHHNVGTTGDGKLHDESKNAHKSFVKTHLGGHGSAAHKAYHKHMEANHTSSLSHPEGRGVNENYECVNKPEAGEPTANHGSADRGNPGDVVPPLQGSSNTDKFYMAPNATIMHHTEGKGTVLATYGEGVDQVAEVMFKESLKRIPVWELEPVEE